MKLAQTSNESKKIANSFLRMSFDNIDMPVKPKKGRRVKHVMGRSINYLTFQERDAVNHKFPGESKITKDEEWF